MDVLLDGPRAARILAGGPLRLAAVRTMSAQCQWWISRRTIFAEKSAYRPKDRLSAAWRPEFY